MLRSAAGCDPWGRGPCLALQCDSCRGGGALQVAVVEGGWRFHTYGRQLPGAAPCLLLPHPADKRPSPHATHADVVAQRKLMSHAAPQ